MSSSLTEAATSGDRNASNRGGSRSVERTAADATATARRTDFSDAIPLSRVPALLPRLRGGKRVHVATVFRWAQRGIRGVRLAVIQIGAVKCTTPEAIDDFFRRLTDQDVNSRGAQHPPGVGVPHSRSAIKHRPSETRRRAIATATREAEAFVGAVTST